ncbi:lipid II:glycine glycyltransferase FemX [Methanochimaera problematica]|nr:GNAT family N-acetyltransferase [Methanoplanus sp. FWC-SCC4]
MMNLNINISSDDESMKWDTLIDTSSYGTIFHKWEWLKIVEKYSKSTLYPLMVYNGTQIVALCPVYIKNYKSLKMAFSPPSGSYLLYLGPVFINYENLKQNKKESLFYEVQKKIDSYLFSDMGCKYVRIRSSPGLYDSRQYKWQDYVVDPLYTYRIDLTKGIKSVWEGFDRKLRVDINKAKREGVYVEDGDLEDLEFLLNSLSERFIQQGYSPLDHKKYLQSLYATFHKDHMKIFVAKYKGERVGGMISLYYKNILYLWVGIPKSNIPGISANDLVQWEAIEWAYNNGFEYYEEMDSGENQRLRYFKSKYNPELCIWYSASKHSSKIYKFAEMVSKIL